jgi:hypothetical protein
MTTLFDVMLETARLSGILRSGSGVYGGVDGTTGYKYMTDTTRLEKEEYFTGGTIFFKTSKLFAKVLKFEQTTGKISFLASTAITADEPYSVTNTDPYALIEAVNSALTHMGTYTKVDETLSSDTTSTEYTLPSGVSNLVRVEYSVGDSFSPQLSWREIEGKLYTYTPFKTAGTIRLYYNTLHPYVEDADDVISDAYNYNRLAWTAVYMFQFQRLQLTGNYSEKETSLMSLAQREAEKLARAFPVHHLERDPILGRF